MTRVPCWFGAAVGPGGASVSPFLAGFSGASGQHWRPAGRTRGPGKKGSAACGASRRRDGIVAEQKVTTAMISSAEVVLDGDDELMTRQAARRCLLAF